MNTSNVKTEDKVKYLLRLSPELYKKVRHKVYLKKNEELGYSINEYLTELIVKDMQNK